MIGDNALHLLGCGPSTELGIAETRSRYRVEMKAAERRIEDVALVVLLDAVAAGRVQVDVAGRRVVVWSKRDAVDMNREVQIRTVDGERDRFSVGAHRAWLAHLPRPIDSSREYDDARIGSIIVGNVSKVTCTRTEQHNSECKAYVVATTSLITNRWRRPPRSC